MIEPSAAQELEATDEEEQSAMRQAVSRFLDSMEEKFSSDDAEEEEELGVLEIANQAFDAMQGAISRAKLAAYPPDRVITIPRNAAMTMEFDRAVELIELGYTAAREQLDPT